MFKTLDILYYHINFLLYTLIKQSNFKHNFLHEHNIEQNMSKNLALQHSIIGKKNEHNRLVPTQLELCLHEQTQIVASVACRVGSHPFHI